MSRENRPEVVLFIASSLDGYIARPDGSLDWLFTDGDYGYSAFSETLDGLMMGRRAYELAAGFEPYPYQHLVNVIFSRSLDQSPHGEVTQAPIAEVLANLRGACQRVWLMGGASLIQQFHDADAIDELVIAIHPILLGAGIPLWQNLNRESHWTWVDTKAYSTGLLQVRYRRRRD